MYSGDHVHECEWYRHTSTVLYHMLSSLPCYVDCAHSMQGRLDKVLSTEMYESFLARPNSIQNAGEHPSYCV